MRTTALAVLLAGLLLLLGSGIERNRPLIVASLELPGQTGSIASSNVLTAVPAGLYRAAGYVQVTNPSTGTCTGASTLGWTYNASAKSVALFTSTLNMNVDESTPATSGNTPMTRTFRSDGGSNITHSYSLTGTDCSNAVYDYYLIVEKLQ